MNKRDGVEFARGERAIERNWIDVFTPFDLQRLGRFSTAFGCIEPFIRECAAHAAQDTAVDQVPNGSFHDAPGRSGAEKYGLLRAEERLQLRMNVAVQIPEILAAMTDHWPRKCGQRFGRDFHRTGGKKLVVRDHEKKTSDAEPAFASYAVAGAEFEELFRMSREI